MANNETKVIRRDDPRLDPELQTRGDATRIDVDFIRTDYRRALVAMHGDSVRACDMRIDSADLTSRERFLRRQWLAGREKLR